MAAESTAAKPGTREQGSSTGVGLDAEVETTEARLGAEVQATVTWPSAMPEATTTTEARQRGLPRGRAAVGRGGGARRGAAKWIRRGRNEKGKGKRKGKMKRKRNKNIKRKIVRV